MSSRTARKGPVFAFGFAAALLGRLPAFIERKGRAVNPLTADLRQVCEQILIMLKNFDQIL
jgi:hypothetical protein